MRLPPQAAVWRADSMSRPIFSTPGSAGRVGDLLKLDVEIALIKSGLLDTFGGALPQLVETGESLSGMALFRPEAKAGLFGFVYGVVAPDGVADPVALFFVHVGGVSWSCVTSFSGLLAAGRVTRDAISPWMRGGCGLKPGLLRAAKLIADAGHGDVDRSAMRRVVGGVLVCTPGLREAITEGVRLRREPGAIPGIVCILAGALNVWGRAIVLPAQLPTIRK